MSVGFPVLRPVRDSFCGTGNRFASLQLQRDANKHAPSCGAAISRRLQRSGLALSNFFGLDEMSMTMGRLVRGILKHALGRCSRVDGFRLLGRLAADQVGATLVIVAFFVPVLIGVAALGSEVGLWLYTQQLLQAAADSAAISAARAYSLNPGANYTAQANAVTANYCFPNGTCLVNGQNNVTVSVTLINPYTSPGGGTYDTGAIKVVVQQKQVPLLTNYFSGMYSTPLVITSTAVAVAPPNTCILALDPSATGSAVTVAFLAAINLTGCSLFTDSTSNSSINVALLAEIVATGGGTIGTKGQVADGFLGFISPAPIQNVAVSITDPYAADEITTPLPTVPAAFTSPGACTTTINFAIHNPYHLVSGTVYCAVTVGANQTITAVAGGTYQFNGGITVNNGGAVTLAGTTTVKGSIDVNNGGTVTLNAGTYSINSGSMSSPAINITNTNSAEPAQLTVNPGTYTLYGDGISVNGAHATFNSNSGNYTMTLVPLSTAPTTPAPTNVVNGGTLTFGAGTFTMSELTENNGNVTLNGGIYILNSDSTTTPMLSLIGSTLTGTSSTLVFTSSSGEYDGTALNSTASTLNLIAPTTGATAGIALFGNNSPTGTTNAMPPGTNFTFDIDSTFSVNGTVYLPQGSLSFYAFEFNNPNLCTQIIVYTINVEGLAYFGDNCGAAGTLPIAAITPQLLQ